LAARPACTDEYKSRIDEPLHCAEQWAAARRSR